MNEREPAADEAAVIEPSVFSCNSSWHPDSALACGRCGAIICPDCLIHAPGGTRCKPCANLRRPPMYEVGVTHYLRAAGIMLVLALPIGFGAALIPSFGFFSLFIGFIAGRGLGSLFAQAITRASGGKRGVGIQSIAVAGAVVLVLVLLLTRVALLDLPFGLIRFNLMGPVAAVVAASVAWQRLR
jgi:hypothetical protein